MKLFAKCKDGGHESNVTGYFLVEIKWLFSIVLLKFERGSREAYHSHAFNAVSWIFNDVLCEYLVGDTRNRHQHMWAGWKPIWTPRSRCHKVYNRVDRPVWAISFRGPWLDTWRELRPIGPRKDAWEDVTLTHGRKVIG